MNSPCNDEDGSVNGVEEKMSLDVFSSDFVPLSSGIGKKRSYEDAVTEGEFGNESENYIPVSSSNLTEGEHDRINDNSDDITDVNCLDEKEAAVSYISDHSKSNSKSFRLKKVDMLMKKKKQKLRK